MIPHCERLAERETILYRSGSEFNRTVQNFGGNPIIRSGNNTWVIRRDFVANEAIHTKKKPKKEVDYFWKHQKTISDYDKVF
jgi:hypothetical protein